MVYGHTILRLIPGEMAVIFKKLRYFVVFTYDFLIRGTAIPQTMP
jgi:hypothetical protein